MKKAIGKVNKILAEKVGKTMHYAQSGSGAPALEPLKKEQFPAPILSV